MSLSMSDVDLLVLLGSDSRLAIGLTSDDFVHDVGGFSDTHASYFGSGTSYPSWKRF